MKKFADVSTTNVVTNLILAENQEQAELVAAGTCVEYTDDNPAGIDWDYDPNTGVFTPTAPINTGFIDPTAPRTANDLPPGPKD